MAAGSSRPTVTNTPRDCPREVV